MKIIISDLCNERNIALESSCDERFDADGRHALCQGCFGCWTKHPAECFINLGSLVAQGFARSRGNHSAIHFQKQKRAWFFHARFCCYYFNLLPWL
ncbi:MAG: hypothetical protein II038_15240 [Lachnospiraceae bacterium]|nr:hypothetical protein [Lachnospiraceae bacterium]